MNIDNGFDINISIFYAMSTKLGGLGTKSKDHMIYFSLMKEKISHNSTSELFSNKVKLLC